MLSYNSVTLEKEGGWEAKKYFSKIGKSIHNKTVISESAIYNTTKHNNQSYH